jgi:hypothetical protein
MNCAVCRPRRKQDHSQLLINRAVKRLMLSAVAYRLLQEVRGGAINRRRNTDAAEGSVGKASGGFAVIRRVSCDLLNL